MKPWGKIVAGIVLFLIGAVIAAQAQTAGARLWENVFTVVWLAGIGLVVAGIVAAVRGSREPTPPPPG